MEDTHTDTHTLFNVIGVLITVATFCIPWGGEPAFFRFIRWMSADGTLERQIANAHTVFNVVTTLILLPFVSLFAKLCEKIIPLEKDKVKYKRLEPHLLNTPSIALAQTASALRKMLKHAWKMTACALNIYAHDDEKNQERVKTLEQREEDVDSRQHDIADYLSKLMLKPLAPAESRQIPVLLHCTNDAEKIGDYALELRDLMQKIKDGEVRFSEPAEFELEALRSRLNALAEDALELLKENSPERLQAAAGANAEFLKKLDLAEQTHMTRLCEGKCKPANGVLYLELLEKIRKISRHLYNITERAGQFYTKLPRVG